MKTSLLYTTLVLFLGLTSCAQKPKTETATTITPSAHAVVTQKEAALDTIEKRLNAQRDLAHQGKFSMRNNTDRQFLDRSYAKLGDARLQLEELRNTQEPARFSERTAMLNATIAQLNDDVGLRIGE